MIKPAVEQVNGHDSQFRIASGESLEDLGIANQAAIEPPRGYAVQARIVAGGAGVLTAYKEPAGPGAVEQGVPLNIQRRCVAHVRLPHCQRGLLHAC